MRVPARLLSRVAALALLLASTAAWSQELESPAQELQAQPGVPMLLQVARHQPQPQRILGRGIASWYGPRFQGRPTASGEVFDMDDLTAAHRTLPFGTVVQVRSLVNGRVVHVRINDRGPFKGGRIIDLSRAAAHALGLLEAGTGTKPVLLTVLSIRPERPRLRTPHRLRGEDNYRSS